MADIVSKKLSQVLNLEEVEEIEQKEKELKNPITKQPIYESSLITEDDVQYLKELEEGIGLETFSKIILMKVARKSMNDHDELIETMAKVDDSKAARLAEVAVGALNTASDAAKSLMMIEQQNKKFELEKEKLAVEREKLEVKIKSITVNQIGVQGETSEDVIAGTQKEILEQIKQLMVNESDNDDTPPLIDN